ncbi:MAG TPA: DUF418 domain-containing protein [Flavisolibacter sp.]|jgi:uncharacterized protein|nr:DUF418 domain-containing protein [Flavisolibacter sp.]
MQAPALPVKDRLEIVDSLRGFALFGIMLAHFIFWYTAGPLPGNVYTMYNDFGSSFCKLFTDLFVTGKFFALFSFLFGLSFYLQSYNATTGKGMRIGRYSWRLVLLFLIGVVHHSFWQGDILSIYAPLGFLLLASRKLSDRWVLILGFALVLNVPGKVFSVVQLFSHQGPGGMMDFDTLGKEYDQLITKGSWLDIIRYNLSHTYLKANFQLFSGRIFITMGFFLLGMYTGRKRWFENLEEKRVIWKRILKRSALFLGVSFLIGLSLILADSLGSLGLEQNPYAGLGFNILNDVYSAALVVVFVSGITVLTGRKRWQHFFSSLAPVGKLALTSYLTQTVFGLLLFFGAGFGLYTKTSQAVNYLMGIAFFAGQVAFSKWWLRRYYFGPVEWLWRSATQLQWQAFRKKVSSVTPEPGGVTVLQKKAATTPLS